MALIHIVSPVINNSILTLNQNLNEESTCHSLLCYNVFISKHDFVFFFRARFSVS